MDIETAQANLEAARRTQQSANEAVTEAVRALNDAKSANAPPHPWEGKKVRRFVHGVFTSRGRWVTGVLNVWRGSYPLYIRGLRVDCGELYVRSLSGKTGYCFKGGRNSQPWELVE